MTQIIKAVAKAIPNDNYSCNLFGNNCVKIKSFTVQSGLVFTFDPNAFKFPTFKIDIKCLNVYRILSAEYIYAKINSNINTLNLQPTISFFDNPNGFIIQPFTLEARLYNYVYEKDYLYISIKPTDPMTQIINVVNNTDGTVTATTNVPFTFEYIEKNDC